MPHYMFVIAAFFSLILSACGGSGGGGSSDNGGGSGSTSISVSTASLSFTAVEGSAYNETKTITVTFKGDGLVIGYPTGMSAASWLMASQTEATQSPVTTQFSVNALSLGQGTYTTTIRFVTGKEDGSQIKYVDVPVTLTVKGLLQSSTQSLNFSATEGVQPASQTLTLHSDTLPAGWQLDITYHGETKDWLVPESLSGTLSSADTTVNIAAKALANGQYGATIYLRDSNAQIRKSIPVTYNVNPGFSISGTTTKAISEKSSAGDLSWSLNLQTNYNSATGTNFSWQLTSDQPWLKVVNASGNLASNQSIQLQLSAEELMKVDNGTLTANLNLAVANSAVKSQTIPVQVSLNLQPALGLTNAPNEQLSLSFFVGNSTLAQELKRTVKVETNVGSAFSSIIQWQAVTGASWLKLTKASGDTGSNSLLQFEVDTTELAKLDNGSYGALVTLKPTHPRYKDLVPQVNLQMYLASVEHIAPYVAYTGRSEPIIIRGQGFNVQPLLTLNFGNTLMEVKPTNDSEIRLNYPVLASAQRVTISIRNELNLNRGTAELVYQPAPVYTPQKIKVINDTQANDYFRTITLDPERNAVLLAGYTTNQIGRVRLTNTGWQKDSFLATEARAAIPSLDGKDLLVSVGIPLNSGDTNKMVHVDPETLAVKKTVPIVSAAGSSFPYDLIVPFNNGKTLLSQSSSFPSALWYPSLIGADTPSIYQTEIALSRDRSRLLLGSAYDATNTYAYDSNGTGAIKQSLNVPQFRSNTVSINRDGTRVVAGDSVYDHDFKLLGTLSPIVYHWNVAVTPDGKYVYLEDRSMAGQKTIKRYNISAASGPFPEDTSAPVIKLADGEFVISMTVSDDGKALFALIYSEYEYPNAAYLQVFPLVD